MSTLKEALDDDPDINLAMISTPGEYAFAEAYKALQSGVSVFMFSDNVTVEEEKTLKELADRRNLLMMGPDCGTAAIDGIPLGFCNVLQQGRVGLVGASGTGLQQVEISQEEDLFVLTLGSRSPASLIASATGYLK